MHVLAVEDEDPVTAVRDMAYILTQSDVRFAEIFEKGAHARVVSIRKSI
jgi:hypothetical protein